MTPKKRKPKRGTTKSAIGTTETHDQLAKRPDEVLSAPGQADEDLARAYWTEERRKHARPLPLPTVDPSKGNRSSQMPSRSSADEVVSEPRGPDNANLE